MISRESTASRLKFRASKVIVNIAGIARVASIARPRAPSNRIRKRYHHHLHLLHFNGGLWKMYPWIPS